MRNRPIHPVLILVSSTAIAFSFVSGMAASADVTIADIIENVRRNEVLYDNLDVKLQYDYSVAGGSGPVRDVPNTGATLQEITMVNATDHYVTQDGMFRFDRTAPAVVGGQATNLDRTRAFDGTTTRLYDQRAVGNVFQERREDADAVRPHMLFLANVIHTPLSTYLSGHKAMAAHPMGGKQWRDRLTIEVTYEGSGERRGLKCDKVWITTAAVAGEPYDRWELWLAEERNYIPVEMTSWTFSYSKTLPLSEGHTSEFREVSPGIWFPLDAEVILYEPGILEREGRQQLRWRRQYTVDTVSLNPQYEVAYFRDVVFPDGTAVYEVENREIKHSYRVGTPEEAQLPAGKSHWVLVANVVVLAFLAAVLIVRRRRRVA